MKELMRLEIELNPLSYNDMYVSRFSKGKKGENGSPDKKSKQWMYAKDETKDYKYTIQEKVVEYFYNKGGLPKLEPESTLTLQYIFGVDAFFKNGNPRKKDCSNFIKPIEDAVAAAIGIDDAYNFSSVQQKVGFTDVGRDKPFIALLLYEESYEDVVSSCIEGLKVFDAE